MSCTVYVKALEGKKKIFFFLKVYGLKDKLTTTKIKTRKIKFVCPDGSSSRKEVEIVRKCGRKKQKNWG